VTDQPWLKLWTEARSDAKLRSLSDAEFRIWFKLLCYAAEQPERGTIRQPLKLIAVEVCDGDENRLVTTCQALQALELLTCNDLVTVRPLHGVTSVTAEIRYTSFKRRNKAPSERQKAVRDRVRKHREKKRSGKSSDAIPKPFSREPCNGHVTANVTTVDTDTDTDTEAEGEGELKTPPAPPFSIRLGPEYAPVGEFAMQVGGDVSWGPWVDRQGQAGHSASDIRAAIEEASGAGKLRQPYVAKILQRWAIEGRPKNGHAAPIPAVVKTPIQRPDLPRTPRFEAIHRMWDAIEAGGKP